MASAPAPITHSQDIEAASLSGGVAWVKRQLERVALDKAAEFYGASKFGADAPTVIVDGRKNAPVSSVKPFGNILFIPALGPVQEAAQLAWSIVQAAAPVLTGHYKSSFFWYVNGRPVGPGAPPDLKRAGRKGNAQLADLAPYATMAEIQVPRGVLYAAFLAVRRTYGTRLSVGFAYKRPQGAFAPNDDPNHGRTYPLNVPVLEIGNKASTVRQRGRPPGSRRRKALRKARRAAT